MAFSRITQSLSRREHQRFIKNGLLGGVTAKPSSARDTPSPWVSNGNVVGGEGRFCLLPLRGYLTSIRPTTEWGLSKDSLLGVDRFFSLDKASREIPKEETPKGDDHKGDKEDWKEEEHENLEEWMDKVLKRMFYFLIGLFCCDYGMSITFSLLLDLCLVSFEEFKTQLLEPGLVDHIVVVSNKSVAEVYVRNFPNNGNDIVDGLMADKRAEGNTSKLECYVKIGSVKTFEMKLKEAQEALGIDPQNFVPVTYASEGFWIEEFGKLIRTLAFLCCIAFVLGGGTRKGRGGIFNIRKAPFTRADKNTQNKVYFKELGAKIPKGALLVGPPGTGKTL